MAVAVAGFFAYKKFFKNKVMRKMSKEAQLESKKKLAEFEAIMQKGGKVQNC